MVDPNGGIEDDNTSVTFRDEMGMGNIIRMRFSYTGLNNFASKKYDKSCKFEADLKGL